MEFNLKKILKTLLISTSEPVSIKNIQDVITRYHEQREKAAAASRAAGNVLNDDSGSEEEFAENTAGDDISATQAMPSGGGIAALIAGGVTVENPVPPEPRYGASDTQRVIRAIIDQVPVLLTATQIREAADVLNQDMIDAGEVTRILQGAEGFRLTISPEFSEWVRLLRNDPKPQRLSQSALETLALIAYRQPATRSEIESIRGVSADGALNRLLDLELIIVTGRADLPGRPIQYGTTEKFLDFCGIKSLGELPASDVLSPSQISEWIAHATNPQKLSTGDVGLAEDDGTEARKERTSLLSSEFDLPPGAPPPAPLPEIPASAKPAPLSQNIEGFGELSIPEDDEEKNY